MAQLQKKFGFTRPFLLYVGVWRRYKNLPMLAKAFDKLAEQFDYDLVLAGEPDPFYPEIKEQVMGIKHKDRIRAIGRVNDADLKNLYNAADLTVMPSLHEGFGLPLLESAACGTGVACSDIPTLREVMGQAAEYFDPTNLDNMTDVLSELLSNHTRLEELANLALNRVKHFSWKQAAAETIAIYNSTK
jgi:glycosyltransferase involved in cell wall biosynthesis